MVILPRITGHFLAPTTTFWKTDVILTSEEMEKFIDAYIKAVGNRFKTDMIQEHTHAFIPIPHVCAGLHGVLWHGFNTSSRIS